VNPIQRLPSLDTSKLLIDGDGSFVECTISNGRN
jgi:hypothetical protein